MPWRFPSCVGPPVPQERTVSSPAMPATLPKLDAEELIDDQALTVAGQDAFGLNDFVIELVALCEQTALPANVALFGAWGPARAALPTCSSKHSRTGTAPPWPSRASTRSSTRASPCAATYSHSSPRR